MALFQRCDRSWLANIVMLYWLYRASLTNCRTHKLNVTRNYWYVMVGPGPYRIPLCPILLANGSTAFKMKAVLPLAKRFEIASQHFSPSHCKAGFDISKNVQLCDFQNFAFLIQVTKENLAKIYLPNWQFCLPLACLLCGSGIYRTMEGQEAILSRNGLQNQQ